MFKGIVTTVSIVIVCVLSLSLNQGNVSAKEKKKETVYERVIRTEKLRCGYFVEAPFTIKDENTGEFSGLSVDLAKMIAKELNLEIEWTEQISFATFGQDLNNNRYDMVCGGVFTLPRAGIMDYTSPYAYVSVQGYVRPDNTSFDKAFRDVDWSSVKIAGLDGEGATTAAQKVLPQAQMEILPQLSSVSEMLMLTATGKTDISFVMPSVYEQFNKINPEKLRPAKLDKPLYRYAMGYAIARNQMEFKSMINNTITQLSASGELQTLFDKYDPNGYFDHP